MFVWDLFPDLCVLGHVFWAAKGFDKASCNLQNSLGEAYNSPQTADPKSTLFLATDERSHLLPRHVSVAMTVSFVPGRIPALSISTAASTRIPRPVGQRASLVRLASDIALVTHPP